MAGVNLQGGSDLLAHLSRNSARLQAPRIAEWLLAAVIAYCLAQATWAFFAPLPVPKGDRLAALPMAQQAERDSTARNPFPQAAIIDAQPLDVGPELSETALDLTLTGVWPEAQGGSAIIRRPDGKERRFAIGDEIVSGVKLIGVFSDQVVIEQNGVRESLRFESKAPIERPRVVNTQPAAAGGDAKIANAAPGKDLLGGIVRLAPGENAAGEPAIILSAGADRAAFEGAGLRDGDVLVTINGTAAPQTPAEMIALINNAAQSGSARLVIERDGAQRALTLPFNGSGGQ